MQTFPISFFPLFKLLFFLWVTCQSKQSPEGSESEEYRDSKMCMVNKSFDEMEMILAYLK